MVGETFHQRKRTPNQAMRVLTITKGFISLPMILLYMKGGYTTMAEEKKKSKKVYGYTTKIGKQVTIHFVDGKKLSGKLLKIYQYEVILEVIKDEEPVEVTVFKGAVKYIF